MGDIALLDGALGMNKTLQTVINSSPVVVFLWRGEKDWPVEFVSKNIDMFGYSVEDFISGKLAYGDIVHPDDIDRVRAGVSKCTEGGYSDFFQEYRILTKTGEVRWVDERTQIQHDSQGNVKYLQGIILDIAERKQAEEAILNAKLAAEDANLYKTEFISNMSHELRTPLNAIIGFSDLLKTEVFGKLNKKQIKYVDNVSNSGKHLLGLINNILDISKIEAGKMQLRTEDFELNEIIEDMTSTLSPLAYKKKINVSHTIADNVITVNADKTKFKQILYNLVSNAIKFTDQGGSVTIGGKISEDLVHISVKDSGIGISPEDQDKLFNPFFQVDSSTAREHGGTGLGLALVKKFVEMHGGEIWVESEVGNGSTFTFTIPTDFENTPF